MINLIRNTISSFRAMFGNAAANAFIQATGITGATQKAAITQLCIDLQASGLWSKMKAVYPMVTDNYNTRSYTEDFTNSFWSKYFSTVTGNTIIAPNGTLTGETLNEDNTTNPHSIYSDSNSLANTQYTSSIYVKAGTRRYVQLATTPNANDWAACIFDTTNLSFTKTQVSGNVTATFAFSAEANGWYRLSITWTCTVSGIASPLTVALIDVPTPTLGAYAGYSYTGNSSYVYVWGAQTQLGSLTTYQPILTTPSAFMASQMKYNLKDARDLDAAFRLTWSGGWTYSATGATPNGTNAYANTNLNDSILTPNSSHLSFYSRSNTFQNAYDIGLFNTTNGIWLGVGYTNGIRAGIFQTGASGELNPVTANTLGFVVATKNGNTTNTAYKNGISVDSGVKADTSATNTTIYLGALNQNGSPAYGFSVKQIGFATIGNGLSAQDNMLFNQIVEKYQVALSRGVQAAQSFYYNSAYSNEANTYLYSTQITGTTQVSAINTLINGLKANNLWTKMKAVYPFVTDKTLQADMAAQMKFNLVNPQDSDAAFRLAFSGGWTYSTNGAQPNGTNGYADTKLILSSTIASQNSTHLSYYINQNAKIQAFQMGVRGNNASDTFIGARFSSTQNYNNVNSSVVTLNTETNNVSGMLLVSRTSSANFKYYKNSSLYQTNSTTSSSLPDVFSIYLGTINLIGSTLYPDNTRAAFASIGDGLSDAEIALFYQLVQQFQTDLSRQV